MRLSLSLWEEDALNQKITIPSNTGMHHISLQYINWKEILDSKWLRFQPILKEYINKHAFFNDLIKQFCLIFYWKWTVQMCYIKQLWMLHSFLKRVLSTLFLPLRGKILCITEADKESSTLTNNNSWFTSRHCVESKFASLLMLLIILLSDRLQLVILQRVKLQ